MMRDDPADAPIPERFEASTWHVEQLDIAQTRLRALRGMGANEIAAAAKAALADAIASRDKYKQRRELENSRLLAMRRQVEAWIPPTAEHVGMKDFMLQQLDVSMSSGGSWEIVNPHDYEPQYWFAGEIEKAQRDIAYHTKERAAEIKRAEDRTAWVNALRTSLSDHPDPPVSATFEA